MDFGRAACYSRDRFRFRRTREGVSPLRRRSDGRHLRRTAAMRRASGTGARVGVFHRRAGRPHGRIDRRRRTPRSGIEHGVKGHVQVLVRDNNVDQALKALKKKMQREGIFREMKMRNHYEKPSEKRAREKAEAVRRARKLARKRAQREGLIPGKKR